MELFHPTHKTSVSMDASTYDEICDLCGATDAAGGTARSRPCPRAVINSDARATAKLATFCQFAVALAKLSTCKRASVGCVLVPDDMSEVLAIGYNGPPVGADNDSCRETQGSCGCIHAEANALVKLRRKVQATTLITTTCPCEHCAGLVVNSKSVDLVLFRTEYRASEGRRVLERAGVKCVSWAEMGVSGDVCGELVKGLEYALRFVDAPADDKYIRDLINRAQI